VEVGRSQAKMQDYLKNKLKQKELGSVPQMIEGKHEALSTNTSIAKKKKY
jgi:hypothetical protein